jgi:hypothetical protein
VDFKQEVAVNQGWRVSAVYLQLMSVAGARTDLKINQTDRWTYAQSVWFDPELDRHNLKVRASVELSASTTRARLMAHIQLNITSAAVEHHGFRCSADCVYEVAAMNDSL